MSVPMYHDLYYTHFKPGYIEEGEILIKEGDEASNLYIVEIGELEVFKEIDGHEFIFERLKKGSILCYDGIFDDNPFEFNIRATKPTHYMSMKADCVKEMQDEYPKFNKKLL